MTTNINTTSPSAFFNAAQFITDTFKSAANAIQSSSVPYYSKKVVESVAQQVSQVWAHMLPLVNGLVAFAKKDIGLATFSILGAAGVATASRQTENSLLAGAFFVGSICLAVLGGVFLTRAGVVPNFIGASVLS